MESPPLRTPALIRLKSLGMGVRKVFRGRSEIGMAYHYKLEGDHKHRWHLHPYPYIPLKARPTPTYNLWQLRQVILDSLA